MIKETTMWAVHVHGPDDLHACPDKQVADALALALNLQFKRQTGPDDPPMIAEVVEWPYGYEQWKADSEQLAFVSKDAK